MIHINHADQVDPAALAPFLSKAASLGLAHFQKNEEVDLTVYLTDDVEIAELNKTWMEKEGPTDVLSFPSDEVDPQTGVEYIGDIILSVDRAKAQADANGHSLENECMLLVAHGVLHLLGFDHYTTEEKDEMWQHQSAILADLGIGDIKITE